MNLLFLLVPKFHIFHIICKAEFAGLFLFFSVCFLCTFLFWPRQIGFIRLCTWERKIFGKQFSFVDAHFRGSPNVAKSLSQAKTLALLLLFYDCQKKVKHSKIKSFFARAKKLNLIFYQRKCPCPRTFVTAL